MKFLILCFAVFAVASAALYTQDEFNTMKIHIKECKEATHVEDAKLDEMRKGHMDDDDHKMKDYLSCIFKKMGWQHDDGSIDKSHVEDIMVRNADAKKAMDECINEHGSTPSETAYLVFKCWRGKLPADFKMAP